MAPHDEVDRTLVHLPGGKAHGCQYHFPAKDRLTHAAGNFEPQIIIVAVGVCTHILRHVCVPRGR